jgi:hypothetical protein
MKLLGLLSAGMLGEEMSIEGLLFQLQKISEEPNKQ